MAVVIAVAGRKGGCGKTSIAVTLGAVGVCKPFHTGTVDLDSQANLSRWALGRDLVSELGALHTVAALEYPSPPMLRDYDERLGAATTREELVSAACRRCVYPVEHVPGLSIIPTAHHIHAETARELVISRLPFEVVIVDCPPDISTWAVRSVLMQADLVISPVICEPWAVDSMAALAKEITSVGRSDLLDRDRVRFVVNMRTKTALHDTLEADIRRTYGHRVSKLVIPRSVAIAEASLDPRILTKKHALWKVGVSLWKELETMAKKQGAAA